MDWSTLRLLPKTEDFYNLFEQLATNAQKGASLLKELVSNFSNVEEKVKTIGDIEHQGDKITHYTIEKLNKTFFTELEREDIHSLICELDDILDLVDSSARKMILYKIEPPTQEIINLVDILNCSVDKVVKAIKCLRNLNKPKEILQHCIDINTLENEGDQLMRATIAKLFEETKDPIYIIKYKEIYETLESAIDRCEDVANILEGIVLKYS